ncbi:hypothetical protein PHSC3_001213 [Chlamydiales bacterium STE3]|nr:hypothetical protein PHSC3_001213 [Chlamydiales bacterium STE3]
MKYYNPYYGQDFFGVFYILIQRLAQFLTGQLGFGELAPDEIQMLVLIGVGASSAIVGCFLVLRKMTMMANSLSHTILLGVLIAFLLSSGGSQEVEKLFEGTRLDIKSMLIASFVIGVLTTFLTEFLTKAAKLQEDASTGIVFTSLFALGVVLVTLLTRNAHIGVEVIMGNVDALHLDDFKLVYIILAANILFFTLFYKEFQLTTFDPAFARAIGISAHPLNYLLMALVSATIIGAFRAVGVLMVLAFITGPALASRVITNSLSKMLFLAVGFGVLASLLGVAVSRHILTVYGLALSTAGIVVTVTVIIYLFVMLAKSVVHSLSKSSLT